MFKFHLGLTTALACIALAALCASAMAAGSCPNEQLRAEDHSTSLPDCRAYELVSPPYKQGHPVIVPGPGDVSADGSHVIGTSLGVFAGAEDDPQGIDFVTGVTYEFSRADAGWMTAPLTPPASQFADDAFRELLVSSDFGTTAWVLRTPSQFDEQRDLYLRLHNGAFVRVGPMTPPGQANSNDEYPVGASNDLSHVFFVLQQTRWPGDTTTLQGTPNSLYETTLAAGGAEPKLVGVKNEGSLVSNAEAQLISQCQTVLGNGGSEQLHAVSADGETVFFTAREALAGSCIGPQVNELYARVKGAKTVAISEPVLPVGECSGACATATRQNGVFQGASEDGSKVFFTTTQPLLNSDLDTTNDLYQAEVTSSGIQKLILVSKGDSSDATQGNGARVLGVSAVSNDGSRVYFVAEGVLTTAKNNQGQQAVGGAPNLYTVEPASGRTAFITTLSSPQAESPQPTPDGRFLVFGSAEQVFEYDSQTGALIRVASQGYGQLLSHDGSYVFFDSTAALTPEAVSGRQHVYEYHDGQVHLISDGQDVEGEGARLIGIDTSGENVFFTTLDRLVSQDTDTQVDVYDARVNGGFPAPVPATGCSGEGCRGALSVAPALSAASSVTQAGGGNLAPPVSKPAVKSLAGARKLANALRACRSNHSRRKRAGCEARARRRYGSPHRARKTIRRSK